MIPNDAVGQHGKGTRGAEAEYARGLHADAAATVGVIHEDEFAAVGVRFFQSGKLSCFGPERFVLGGHASRPRKAEAGKA